MNRGEYDVEHASCTYCVFHFERLCIWVVQLESTVIAP